MATRGERPSPSAAVLRFLLYEFISSFSVPCPVCIFILPTRLQLLQGFAHSQDVFQRRVPDLGWGWGLPRLRLGLRKLQLPMHSTPTRGHCPPPADFLAGEVDCTSRGKTHTAHPQVTTHRHTVGGNNHTQTQNTPGLNFLLHLLTFRPTSARSSRQIKIFTVTGR